MADFLSLNLLNLFTFYLTVAFVISTFRRLRQYRDIAHLVVTLSGRWPRVLQQIKKHWLMFLTWTTFRPTALAISLIAIQVVCTRIIWPEAQITGYDLLGEWWMLPVIVLTGAAMLAVDLYFIIRVGQIDREETERYLDEAEHWLTSWKAPVVKVFTLGFINPRKMVDTEVRKALEEGKGLLHATLWWVSLQAGLRVLFGLSLWIVWAIHPGLGRISMAFSYLAQLV
jgi:hypothetical protein